MDPEEFRKQLKKWAVIGAFFAVSLVCYALGLRRLLIAYVILIGLASLAAILIQSGRGGGLSALGGLGGDSLFSARSATPIARATYVMLALFILNCILITRMGVPREADVLMPAVPEAPALPAATQPEPEPAAPAQAPDVDASPAGDTQSDD